MSGAHYVNGTIRKVRKDYPDYRMTHAEAVAIQSLKSLTYAQFFLTMAVGSMVGGVLYATVCKSVRARRLTLGSISLALGVNHYYSMPTYVTFYLSIVDSHPDYVLDVLRNPRNGVSNFSILAEYARRDSWMHNSLSDSFTRLRASGNGKFVDDSLAAMSRLPFRFLPITNEWEMDKKYEKYREWELDGGILATKEDYPYLEEL